MTKAKKSPEPTVVEAHDPSSLPGKLKPIGRSKSDTWNNVIANQTIQALWRKNSDEEGRKDQANAAVAGLIGINPRDHALPGGLLGGAEVVRRMASHEPQRIP
jgi:hypothetical protein